MRYDYDGLLQTLLQILEFPPHFAPRQRIKRAKRLVHQQDGRIGREGSGHANTLALAAGKLVRIPVKEFTGVQAYQSE